ncbi:MAG: sigma-70 family RNA polymerase sigma factor [Kiritimatiellae bacterium]|nr:sigma-70 family RNA polymerase sigma factor [Kiritimatiellia bacterium]
MPSMRREEVVKEALKYQDAIVGYAFAILRDWELARDVGQDVYIVVMEKWRDFRPGTSMFHWVRRIARNKALQVLDKRRREIPKVDDELQQLVNDAVDEKVDEAAAHKQRLMRKALQHCMAQLRTESVELLKGFYAQRRSCEALAALQKRTVNAVRLVLSRTRDQLRKCMIGRMAALEAQQ